MTAEWLDDWLKENTDIACRDFGYRYVNSILRYETAYDLEKLTFAYYLTLLDEKPLACDWYDDADAYPSLISDEAKER